MIPPVLPRILPSFYPDIIYSTQLFLVMASALCNTCRIIVVVLQGPCGVVLADDGGVDSAMALALGGRLEVSSLIFHHLKLIIATINKPKINV